MKNNFNSVASGQVLLTLDKKVILKCIFIIDITGIAKDHACYIDLTGD